MGLQERADIFRGMLTKEEKHMFNMQDTDMIEDTVFALVREVINLRMRVARLEERLDNA